MTVEDQIIEMADEGDPAWATAAAILIVGNKIAAALRALGNGDAFTPMGAIEGLAKHIGEKLDGLAEAIAGDMS